MRKPGPCQCLSPCLLPTSSPGPSPGSLAGLPVPPPGPPLRPDGLKLMDILAQIYLPWPFLLLDLRGGSVLHSLPQALTLHLPSSQS